MIVDDPNLVPDKFIVACHIICDGKILYVKRNLKKPQGGKWGSLAGKRENGEEEIDAIKREVFEESGLAFYTSDFHHIKTWKVVFNTPKKNVSYSSFSYSLYKVILDDFPKINLRKEELIDFGWYLPEDALKIDLVEDEDNILREIYNF